MPKRKNTKRTFEDISGNNSVFVGEVLSTKGEPVTEFAIVVSDIDNKDLAVTILSKSDIPRLIRVLTKLI